MYIQAVVTRNNSILMERNFYKKSGVTRESVIARLESYIIREMLNYAGECWIAAREIEGPMPKAPGKGTRSGAARAAPGSKALAHRP